MQIFAGWAKGMTLKTPDGSATRPTSAKVRAAILNSLAPFLEDAAFLDLFAGSGALGLEAMSRGARAVVLVEQDPAAIKCLQINVAEIKRRAESQGLEVDQLRVVPRDVTVALRSLGDAAPFDIVCMDPPYRDAGEWFRRLARPLAELCGDDARWVVESPVIDFSTLLAVEDTGFPWVLVREKSYGETQVTTWQKLVQGVGNEDAEGHDGAEKD